MTEPLGQWLKGHRERLGLTLRDVERATEGAISNPRLSQIENGRIANPSLLTAAWLAVVYDISASDIMDRAFQGHHYEPPPRCPTCGQVIP